MPSYKVIRKQNRETLGTVTAVSQAAAQLEAETRYPEAGYLELSLLPSGGEVEGSVEERGRAIALATIAMTLREWARAARVYPGNCRLTMSMPMHGGETEDSVLIGSYTWNGYGDYMHSTASQPKRGGVCMEVNEVLIEKLILQWAMDKCCFPLNAQVELSTERNAAGA
jgi:hypothetical protein